MQAVGPEHEARLLINPPAVGPSPTRPTTRPSCSFKDEPGKAVDRCRRSDVYGRHAAYAFRSHRAAAERVLACQGARREGPADRTRDPVPEDVQDRTRSADRARKWNDVPSSPSPLRLGSTTLLTCWSLAIREPGAPEAGPRCLMDAAGRVIRHLGSGPRPSVLGVMLLASPTGNWSGSFSVAAVSVFPISVQAVQPGDFHRLV